MTVSFDFDSTLDQKPMQDLCKKFIDLGAEVFVTTSRPKKFEKGVGIKHDDLYKVTDQLGIEREKITFTHYQDKDKFVKDFDLHFDDDETEIFLINEYPIGKCIGVLYEKNNKRESGIVNI